MECQAHGKPFQSPWAYVLCLRTEPLTKVRQKAICCIFVGYDHKRKGWKCCDPKPGHCYTSRNVVFDEASSWWSLQVTVLPKSKRIEEKSKQRLEGHSEGDKKELSDEGVPQEESVGREGDKR